MTNAETKKWLKGRKSSNGYKVTADDSWNEIRHIVIAAGLAPVTYRKCSVINLGTECQVWDNANLVRTCSVDDAAHYLRAEVSR